MPAAADDAAWRLLQQGGNVVLMRHAVTTSGVGDPPGFRIEDCATQRNLSAAGRRQAEAAGAALRQRGVPVEAVLSSEWCRCLDTARLAFGKAEPLPELNNLFGAPERRDSQTAALRAFVESQRPTGNLVLVTHGSTIQHYVGVHPAMGELVILARSPEGFAVAGRLLAARAE